MEAQLLVFNILGKKEKAKDGKRRGPNSHNLYSKDHILGGSSTPSP